MPDRSNVIIRRAALLTVHILGLVAGLALLVALNAWGDSIGVGGDQLTLVAALGLSFLRLIPSVHRAAEANKTAISYPVMAAFLVTVIGISLMVYAYGSLTAVAGFTAGLIFWSGWLNLLQGLIPLKAALAALESQSPSRRGTTSA